MLKSPTLAGWRDLGESEVQNFGPSAGGDEDVSRLDVTMDDALCVGRLESIQHLAGDIEQSVQFQRIA